MTVLEKPVAVGAVVKNATEEVRVSLQHFKGHDLIDVRVFGKFSAAKTFMGTGKGVAINVAKLPDLIALLIEAERQARDLGLLPPGEA
jgi:hypothetical protein